MWRNAVRPVTDLLRRRRQRLSSLAATTSPPAAHAVSARLLLLPLQDGNACDFGASDDNVRLATVRLTAAFLSGVPLLMELPAAASAPAAHCPAAASRVSLVVPEPDGAKVVEDPLRPSSAPMVDPATSVKKHAHRMIRIRKRKMKVGRRPDSSRAMFTLLASSQVHQRRKRKRKFFARFRRVEVQKTKRKECAFRVTLMEKVSVAKKFDAQKYVADYLDDLHKPLIPRTFKGKNLPEFLIKELMEKEELEKQRVAAEKQDIITKEPLVLPGETVEQFVHRVSNKHGWKPLDSKLRQ
jgi:hypothetical protein